MKNNSLKACLKCLLLSTFIILASSYHAYAADTVSTIQDLQSHVSTAMHSRATSYNVIYTGDTTTLVSDLSRVVNNIWDADDYMKYTSKNFGCSYVIGNGYVNVTYTFSYWNTQAMDSYVSSRVTDILNQIITTNMNDYQKEKAVHDWIEKNVGYDTTLVKHSDYDALTSPYKTVCQGYALLAYKMLNQVGIKTKILEGVANKEAHAWNEVYLDGAWYQFDPTWDDPLPDVAGRVLYDYYNLTDDQIKVNHTWTKTYPTANTVFSDVLNSKIASDPSNSAFYQELGNDIGTQFLQADQTASNASDLGAKIQQAINNNQTSLKLRYLSASTFATDIQIAIKGITNITSYSYSLTPFTRTTESTDAILTLNFTYFKPVSVSSISLSKDSIDLTVGGTTGTLVANIYPINASNKGVIWTSSDTSVATVSGGVIKAIAGGTVTITAITADGNYKATCAVNVKQGVSSITLNKTSSYLKIGDPDLTLTATVNPSTATDKRITWTSNNPNVATVDSNGIVHAVATGTAVITVSSVQDPTKVARCTITVPILVTGVSINPSTVTLKMGTTFTLSPILAPTNATIRGVSWSSSDVNVVKVSTTGVLTPVAPGTATITVTTEDGKFTATSTITVIYGVTSIALDKTFSYLKIGDQDLTLTATVNPSTATDKRITWTSSNPNVATVDSNGTVHAVATGTAIITVSSVQDPTKVAKCTITVPILVTGVSINPSTVTLKMGTTFTLSPILAPTNATIRGVSWSSSDVNVVKVSTTGVLTPVAPGTATITVTTEDGKFTATSTITVIYGVTSIALDKTFSYLKIGDQDLTLTATVNPSTATDKRITWTSSNPNVATVDSNGTVHAVATGTAIITVSSVQDPTKVAKCTITVPILVTGVSINPSTVTLKMGTTFTLSPVLAPTNATIRGVSWSSSDVNVVKVSTTGVLTPVAPGTATITVTTEDGKFTATSTITVIYGVTSIALDKTFSYLKIGDPDLTLTATVNPLNATDKRITWTSSNPNVATVDSNGIVHAVATGTAVITVSSVQDPTKVARCTITVPILVTGVSINSSTVTLKMGTTLTLSPILAPTNATIRGVSWSSSNVNVVKVSTTGVLTPVAPGTATITVTTEDGKFTATSTITVIYGVTSITLDKTSASIKLGGSDLTLLATINPVTATDKSITWTSSNPNVATVDSNGVVHAKTAGTVVITVSSVQDPTKIAKCTITITTV